MDTNDAQKINSTFKDFVDLFGDNDLFKEVLFEIFLEEIYNEKNGNNLLVPGQARQKNNPIVGKNGDGEMPTFTID